MCRTLLHATSTPDQQAQSAELTVPLCMAIRRCLEVATPPPPPLARDGVPPDQTAVAQPTELGGLRVTMRQNLLPEPVILFIEEALRLLFTASLVVFRRGAAPRPTEGPEDAAVRERGVALMEIFWQLLNSDRCLISTKLLSLQLAVNFPRWAMPEIQQRYPAGEAGVTFAVDLLRDALSQVSEERYPSQLAPLFVVLTTFVDANAPLCDRLREILLERPISKGLKKHLIDLLTFPDVTFKRLAGEFLCSLCHKDDERFVALVGVGPAAGILKSHGNLGLIGMAQMGAI
eukprot:GAFH01001876.1.p2 GENE.GAFH01001876.1~~GAFH01001876.1.p2  ORF type:complete len:289 (-),score=88.36 GAFH01001876.1:136-1002(-)